MTGRRAIGTLLQRAAWTELSTPVVVCRSACVGALSIDGARTAGSGCTTAQQLQAPPPALLRHALQSATMALSFASSCLLATRSTMTVASTTTTAVRMMGSVRGPTRTYASLAPLPAQQPTAAAPSPEQQHPQLALAAMDGDATAASAAPAGVGLPLYNPEVVALRSQLVDSLAVCLGLQQVDLLLSREENRAVFDEMLLLTTLDTAYRLCTSATGIATEAAPVAAPLSLAASASAYTHGGHKSSAEAATDVLTRLSEMLIQMLSQPGALSPEAAVRALRTLAMLRFNPAGDFTGLQTMAAFYREMVVQALDPEQSAPDLAARSPQLLIDLFFGFSRLFDVAARREKELQSQLLMAQIVEEEAAARRREDDEEARAGSDSGFGSGSTATESTASAPAPWQRPPTELGAAFGGAGVTVGDRQLYLQLSRLLAAPGMLSNVPSKSLGTLAAAMATARFTHYPLTQSIAVQTLLRLQNASTAAAAAAALAGIRGENATPVGSDAMATSTLANILSSLSKLGFEHEALCDAAANWMLQRLYGSTGGGGGAAAVPSSRGGSGAGVIGGVEPHHIVDVAVAFTRVKYENMDYLTRASEVLQLKLPQSTPTSVAMMAWAVANSKSGRSPEFQPLLNALAQRMVALHRHTHQAKGGARGSMQVVPRHLACILFAMARLGQLHPRLMDTVAQDVVERADSYQARQLVNVLRAFALLEVYRPDAFTAACAVLEDRLRSYADVPTAELAANPPAPAFVFAPQNYSDLAWAVALSGHAPQAPGLMELLVARMTDVAPQMGKSGLVRTAQALAVASSAPGTPQAFDALAQASRLQLVDLGPAYLAALVESFAEVQHPVTEEFWLACMDAAGLKVPHMERPRADMQLAASRLVAAFGLHPATQQFEACRSHYVLPLLNALVSEPGQQQDDSMVSERSQEQL